MNTKPKIKELHPHDVCPQCDSPSVPAHGEPDQTLRGCEKCGNVWVEELSRPATRPKQNRYYIESDGNEVYIADTQANDRLCTVGGITNGVRRSNARIIMEGLQLRSQESTLSDLMTALENLLADHRAMRREFFARRGKYELQDLPVQIHAAQVLSKTKGEL